MSRRSENGGTTGRICVVRFRGVTQWACHACRTRWVPFFRVKQREKRRFRALPEIRRAGIIPARQQACRSSYKNVVFCKGGRSGNSRSFAAAAPKPGLDDGPGPAAGGKEGAVPGILRLPPTSPQCSYIRLQAPRSPPPGRPAGHLPGFTPAVTVVTPQSASVVHGIVRIDHAIVVLIVTPASVSAFPSLFNAPSRPFTKRSAVSEAVSARSEKSRMRYFGAAAFVRPDQSRRTARCPRWKHCGPPCSEKSEVYFCTPLRGISSLKSRCYIYKVPLQRHKYGAGGLEKIRDTACKDELWARGNGRGG